MKPYYVFVLLIVTCRSSAATTAAFSTCKKACDQVSVALQTPVASSLLLQADHEQFKSDINKRIQLLTQTWERTSSSIKENYETQIQKILKSVGELKQELKNTREALCPLRYKQKCFWAVFESVVNYTDAAKICARIPGGKPANIYDHDHLFITLKYLRSLARRNRHTVYAWLGMTVDPETEVASFTNGETPSYVKWRPHKPEYSLSYTQLLIMARTDGRHKQEGLYNENPLYKKPGVLCEV